MSISVVPRESDREAPDPDDCVNQIGLDSSSLAGRD